MGGVHHCAVGICDADGASGDAFIDEVGGDGAKMGGASTASNGIQIGWEDGAGTYRHSRMTKLSIVRYVR